MSAFEAEVKKGERFEFGKNWRGFLSTLTDERVIIAEASIKEMMRVDDLTGKTVLDIGSGSGLFSLAARNLGARVYSFDYDPASVACTWELRSRYFPDDPHWVVEEGSVLDETFLNSLGSFDVVYSWGGLHHTGNMWSAIANAASLVNGNGSLFIAIYNDQGRRSIFWRKIKNVFCSGALGKTIVSSVFIPCFFLEVMLLCIIKRENVFSGYKRNRGMSIVHDWFDWLGGFPFEVAKVEEVFHFLREKGFCLKSIKTTNGHGNNQFVFVRAAN
ncbi:class I SAM-dependent methyltransferase [Halomonas kalidii]|uniref:Class I SAM-dependent methyltransferase n=1 Tax=Halomonas kalidii TaxID=3043293 RepID=A0ABT6VJK3_9GAMM|nr:class I SAM-dependent methyltransferase [Halomonas kalidii]MDI5934170.1 class I SAM-dependent methyltransferase [Halomonas kalidii]